MQQVTKPDILWAARSLKAIKVPGPDQTPNKATKLLWSIHLKETIDLFSKCLRERERFPTDGSASGQAVLLYKSGKPPGAGTPISLMDTIGNVFEKVVAARLEESIATADALSSNQYGFRKGFSMLDAISTAAKAIARSRWMGGTIIYCLVVARHPERVQYG